MDIITFAELQGISPQRARELARTGKVPARREGRAWVIEYEGHAPREAPRRRPLSAQSKTDLIEYLDTRTLDHVTGYRRTRLVQRVRELLAAENPAALLREYFADAPAPEGRGGKAIVKAAMLEFDDRVRTEVRANPGLSLTSATEISRRVHTARLLKGFSASQVAASAGLHNTVYTQLERAGTAPRGNLDAIRILPVLGLHPAKLIVREEH